MRIDELISADDEAALGNYGMRVVDQAEVGPYGLFLVDLGEPGRQTFGYRYQLGLNKNESSFTSTAHQHSKHMQPGEEIKITYLQEFDKVIRDWIRANGTLMFGSHNLKKSSFYKKLLSRRGFTVAQSAASDQVFTVS